MLTVEEAQARVREGVSRLDRTESVPVERCAGRVLAREVRSDSDLPPFDRSAMDGYAVRSDDLDAPPVDLAVVAEVAAGSAPARTVGRGTAARIMTGARIPEGADAVVMLEDTESAGSPQRVRVRRRVEPGANIRRRGENVARDEVVLRPGRLLRPVDVALLATAGHARVPVRERPRVGVLATGDELVEVSARPGPDGIRNSNGPMIAALAAAAGAEPVVLGIARDDPRELERCVRRGLELDALVLTGGVSMGDHDHVAPTLERAGVGVRFHRVAMKPGKPVLFGCRGRVPVFGLPGNPVSSFVGFELFVRPALCVLDGRESAGPRLRAARAGARLRGAARLEVYVPCRVSSDGDGLVATPVRYGGSGDIHGAARADGFARVEAGGEVAEGERVGVLLVGEA